jgi:transketolase
MSSRNEEPSTPNPDLRLAIVDLVRRAGEGHIPSSFSIVDIVAEVYRSFMRLDVSDPTWDERDRFILSKGHGAAALFVVLAERGLIPRDFLDTYGTLGGVLGGHPDSLTTDFVEASTGSLGHGLPGAVGMALGLRIRGLDGRVVVLVGDGECHEGTIWESANVAANLKLSNLLVFVDWNQSAMQLMPIDDLAAKWSAFGWEALQIDGHDSGEINEALSYFAGRSGEVPIAVIARTTKGKGVPLVEGHGLWHHKVPSDEEYQLIRQALTT